MTDGVDDEDEVLLALANSLGKMIPSVGGGSYAQSLLPPIELLLMVEENTVRDAATASASMIASALPDEIFQDKYASMLTRLARKEWFTARISSAGLIANAYPRLTQTQQEEHLKLFAELCQDDTPMVRRVAAQNLGIMVENVVQVAGRCSLEEGGVVTTILIPLYETLSSNEQPVSLTLISISIIMMCIAAVLSVYVFMYVLYTHYIYIYIPITSDCCVACNNSVKTSHKKYHHNAGFVYKKDSVRLQTTENCVVFGRVMGNLVTDVDTNGEGPPLNDHEKTLIQRLLPLIVATIDDRSWRVRWTAAAKFADVINAYNPIPGAMDALIPAYEKLLQDPEAEVRTAATFNLAKVAQGCESMILPMTAVGAEGDDDVSAAANFTGERVSAAERLVKRVTLMTEDDSEHVRAALAMVATELAPILGRDATITHLVPPILLLLRDAASEVRLNLISSLESLNKVIGVDLLSQSLLPAILDLAQDGKWRYVNF